MMFTFWLKKKFNLENNSDEKECAYIGVCTLFNVDVASIQIDINQKSVFLKTILVNLIL